MARAYEGKEARQLALDLGFVPAAPPTQCIPSDLLSIRETPRHVPMPHRLCIDRGWVWDVLTGPGLQSADKALPRLHFCGDLILSPSGTVTGAAFCGGGVYTFANHHGKLRKF
ncbi:hypothetical protein [Tahibacter aquaticus]|uniref:hypothetical protein n=1 Tax=Tahibacter aquaticus TaxID=520092 RepID=UPI00105F0E6B